MIEECRNSLVCIPSEQEVDYIRTIPAWRKERVVFLTTDPGVQKQMFEEGYRQVLLAEPEHELVISNKVFSNVLLLEHSLLTTGMFLHMIRERSHVPIMVVTNEKAYPTEFYTKMGATYVLYSTQHRIDFLFQ